VSFNSDSKLHHADGPAVVKLRRPKPTVLVLGQNQQTAHVDGLILPTLDWAGHRYGRNFHTSYRNSISLSVCLSVCHQLVPIQAQARQRVPSFHHRVLVCCDQISLFYPINSSRMRMVADRHRLAAHYNKHCWQAFRGYQQRPWTTLNSKNGGFSEFFAILGWNTHFKSELHRDHCRFSALNIDFNSVKFQPPTFKQSSIRGHQIWVLP